MQTTALVLALAVVVPQASAASAVHRPMRRDSVSTIEVQNDRNVPVTVFLERGDFDVRIGTVGPLQTGNLPVQAWMLRDGGVQLYVQPLGEMDLESPIIDVPRGDHLAVLVPRSDNGFVPQAPPGPMKADLPSDDATATTITVRNERMTPVVIYIDHGDYETRVGTVAARTTSTLKVPDWVVLEGENLAVVVHPQNGWDLASQNLRIRLHEHMGLTVPMK